MSYPLAEAAQAESALDEARDPSRGVALVVDEGFGAGPPARRAGRGDPPPQVGAQIRPRSAPARRGRGAARLVGGADPGRRARPSCASSSPSRRSRARALVLRRRAEPPARTGLDACAHRGTGFAAMEQESSEGRRGQRVANGRLRRDVIGGSASAATAGRSSRPASAPGRLQIGAFMHGWGAAASTFYDEEVSPLLGTEEVPLLMVADRPARDTLAPDPPPRVGRESTRHPRRA